MGPKRPRQLFIVARDQPHLLEQLKRDFAGVEGIEVMLDRRKARRRRSSAKVMPERRRTERRLQQIVAELSSIGFSVVVVP